MHEDQQGTTFCLRADLPTARHATAKRGSLKDCAPIRFLRHFKKKTEIHCLEAAFEAAHAAPAAPSFPSAVLT